LITTGRKAGRSGSGIAATLALALLAQSAAASAEAWFQGLEGVGICHGFGCRYESSVTITGEEWRQIEAFFRKPAGTPTAEREQIRRAVGWFEVIVGRHSPIHLDRGKNELPGKSSRVRLGRDEFVNGRSRVGQMDCIDESRNVTTYLTLMEQAGLFDHHRVVERALRQSAVDQHYAGQIEEIDSGERWVVDSWFYDFGSLPYLEESREWHDIPFLFSTSFPEADDE